MHKEAAAAREFTREIVRAYQSRPESDRLQPRSLFELMLAGASGTGTEMDAEVIVDNILLFLFAGSDTR